MAVTDLRDTILSVTQELGIDNRTVAGPLLWPDLWCVPCRNTLCRSNGTINNV